MPVYTNHCNHADHEFIGTIEAHQPSPNRTFKLYDVYVYAEGYHGHEVCIRYGNEGYQYMSPGPIHYLAKMGSPVHKKALELICEKGRFIYERR